MEGLKKPSLIYKLTGIEVTQLKNILEQTVSTPLEKLLSQALLRVETTLEKEEDGK